MKVLYDSQVFDWQINGGISRYFAEIINRIDTAASADVLFRCVHSYNNYIQSSKWLAMSPVLKGVDFKGKLTIVKKINELFNRRYSNNILAQGKADVFHPTYFDPYFLPKLGKTPFVLTVHDLTNERYPDDSALTRKMLQWKRQLVERADHFIAVSQHTKNDMVEFYKVDPEKIAVAHLSSPFSTLPQPDHRLLPVQLNNKRFLLYVGSRNGYKNFSAFLRQVKDVLLDLDMKLVIAGGGALSVSEKDLLAELKLSHNSIALSHISDSKLIALYQHADVFVFPSLYEGFGIPVLEALQCGCPVLASNRSSLPEVGGDAAFYFDPDDEGDLRKKLLRMLHMPAAEKEGRINKGTAHAAGFNWEKSAAIHLEVYKKIARNG